MANESTTTGTDNLKYPRHEDSTTVPIEANTDADHYHAGMLHAANLCREEFGRGWKVSMEHSDSPGYQSGYEDACDHLSIAIEQAAVIPCVAATPSLSEVEARDSIMEYQADVTALSACLRDLMTAYERRIRSDCMPEQLKQEPWRVAEYCAAEDALRNVRVDYDDDSAALQSVPVTKEK